MESTPRPFIRTSSTPWYKKYSPVRAHIVGSICMQDRSLLVRYCYVMNAESTFKTPSHVGPGVLKLDERAMSIRVKMAYRRRLIPS